ncbi:Glycosyltransferase [Quillaja saponaria]|uniref:Glycosyltransferase n=1 Tax=Quillaja saponaria TaxID=32244 RepID=A0AAD7L554_QUISA|nr:Glycosyltransferase [Quillaja saponaria]
MGLSFCLYFPKMDETLTCDFGELQEPVKIPGCIPIHGSDLPNRVQDRSSEAYKSFLRLSKRLHLADGIVVNSFMDMEPDVIKALQEEDGGTGNPPIYPVGPIIQNGSSSVVDGSECLKWLDNQPPKSVVYVSFGSGGTLSFDQVNELALGLELSGQRFLWAVRAPDNKSANAGYLSVQNEDPLNFLPLGFLERTKGKGQGLVVPNWAPQVEVLSHNSTGGFLTHCGWNSTLESVVHGVPLIAWPLFADQKMNAVMLCDGLKVALRPKVNEKGIVEKEEVGKVVKDLLESEEGERIRNRMKDIKDAATNVLSENGSSTKALSELALRWKNMKLA